MEGGLVPSRPIGDEWDGQDEGPRHRIEKGVCLEALRCPEAGRLLDESEAEGSVDMQTTSRELRSTGLLDACDHFQVDPSFVVYISYLVNNRLHYL